jgi:Flp pilus assembly protein TadG
MSIWIQRRLSRLRDQQGAALVEFAFVVILLLVIVFGIVELGLFYYNNLLITQAARDAVRYLSADNTLGANTSIDTAEKHLISASLTTRALSKGKHGQPSQVDLVANYRTLTPLPGLIGFGSELPIRTSTVMRTE